MTDFHAPAPTRPDRPDRTDPTMTGMPDPRPDNLPAQGIYTGPVHRPADTFDPDAAARAARDALADLADPDREPAAYAATWWNEYADGTDPDGVEYLATFEDAVAWAVGEHVGDLDDVEGVPSLGDVAATMRLTYAGCDPLASRVHIGPVSGPDAFDLACNDTGGLDHADGASAYAADDVDVNYRTGEHARLSWHLLEPSHPGTDGDTWQVRIIREHYRPCDYTGLESADDPVAVAHDGGHCSCTQPDHVDAYEVDLLDVLQGPGGLPYD